MVIFFNMIRTWCNESSKDFLVNGRIKQPIVSCRLIILQFIFLSSISISTVSLDIGPFGVTRAELNDGLIISDTNPHATTNLDPTGIFARSHSLPVGLVWLLLRLGCPVQRSLRALESSRSMSALNEITSNHRHHTLTNTTRLEQLRTMLNRARSQVLIQGATGTGGILSGADRFAAPELDTPLLHPLPTMPALSVRSSLKLPHLPPGVLATPPPVLPHTDHANSCELRCYPIPLVNYCSWALGP